VIARMQCEAIAGRASQPRLAPGALPSPSPRRMNQRPAAIRLRGAAIHLRRRLRQGRRRARAALVPPQRETGRQFVAISEATCLLTFFLAKVEPPSIVACWPRFMHHFMHHESPLCTINPPGNVSPFHFRQFSPSRFAAILAGLWRPYFAPP